MNCDQCNRIITNKDDDKVVFFRMEDICNECWEEVLEMTDSESVMGRPLFTGVDIEACTRSV